MKAFEKRIMGVVEWKIYVYLSVYVQYSTVLVCADIYISNGGLKYAGFHSNHLNEFDLFPPNKNRKHGGFSRKERRKDMT